MSRLASFVLVAVVACAGTAKPQEKPEAQQIAEAVAPLPGPLQGGATVYGYRGGELVTLREGSNMMICLADHPGDDNWHVACYHESLEPFMAMGRRLRTEGITDRSAIDAAREEAIESGELEFPIAPAALYSLTGPPDSFDPTTGAVSGASALYVVYVPYATEESTGISTDPSRGRPWLMFPGKPWAHVMISGGGR
ncbi:MAG: hypothetical protein GWN99_18445 [Gemmatimonadetes bacterium]|uniref:Uncharacterized protein n=1 Tax=Candidatus Kutchimonas denitrificans TaxID=3056748 RepID=A0AAE5CB27_9BACT|nr:hypothetical protein [Gemmatimonadota bacterium]NIR74028.1 hypothetical protein [Candidatus Kutchimonas denitrificans]NIS03017.1 hypothetical protein [Gemmatimonadota bacterium]NIT68734.1 hypothetical protein [Gemmatimonadota bacterium]NIU53315.1 hypothetical protein [Gemmatimonadota bacterium]